MATAAQFRKLALAMPGAEEKSHFGQPDFRVRNKIYAGLSDDETQGTLKLSPESQDLLLAAKPDAFIPAAGAWGRAGWTRVILAKVEVGALPDLIEEAFRLIAPKRLAASLDSAAASSAERPATKRRPQLAAKPRKPAKAVKPRKR